MGGGYGYFLEPNNVQKKNYYYNCSNVTKLVDSFLAPLFEVFPGFVWLKLRSDVILILTSDTFTSKSVLYINCLKKNKEYSGFKENLQFLAENDIYLYINVSETIQPRVDTFC